MRNSHLNIFRTYTKTERKHQLENDLTRALAISLQEDNLFLNELLKYLFKDTDLYRQLQDSFYNPPLIEIQIQKGARTISDFDHILAISLSEAEMSPAEFWNQTHDKEYDPICDLVMLVNNTALIFEAKRDNVNCTAQLYNQAQNICRENNIPLEEMKSYVTPIDLSWAKLMEITLRVYSIEQATNNESRFLSDFIQLVKHHNYKWLPEPSISSLVPEDKNWIQRRFDSAIQEWTKSTAFEPLPNRLGISFQRPWADEINFAVDKEGNLTASIFPGNTKEQGYHIFNEDVRFTNQVKVLEVDYEMDIEFHIKLTSFKRYFAGLWFKAEDLQQRLYTNENFHEFTGRKKRDRDWPRIEALFDKCFKPEYKWRQKANWEQKALNSNRTQFDMSFGYSIQLTIPFMVLKRLDQDKNDLSGIISLLQEIYDQFHNNLLIR